MKGALNTNMLVALHTSREREATAYISGRSYLLRMDEVDRRNLLQAPEQLAVLSALNAYANALTQAADHGVVDDLETASARLGTAAGALGTAAVPTAAPVIGPAFKLSGRLVGLALGNAYAAEIQAVISARNPTIQEIAETMPTSLSAIARLAEAQVEGYGVQRQVLLDAIRRDPKVDRLALYKEYLSARSDVGALQAQANALKNSEHVFRQLAAAHDALAKGGGGGAKLVNEFAATADELSELISALKN